MLCIKMVKIGLGYVGYNIDFGKGLLIRVIGKVVLMIYSFWSRSR